MFYNPVVWSDNAISTYGLVYFRYTVYLVQLLRQKFE